MADPILTRREVRALTGSTVPAEQVAWLNSRKIRHFGPLRREKPARIVEARRG